MGRVLLYAIMASLALFVLAAFVVQRGGGATQAATEVSVHDLSMAPQAYAHQRVTTEGVLQFGPAENQFLITADGLGVVVRGYGVEELRRLDGRTVTVTGRFGFDRETGTYIEAERVTPLQ